MANATCSIDDCEKPSCKRGWCNTHYARWLRTGTPGRVCSTCSAPLFGSGNAIYCSDNCWPRCSFPECVNSASKRGQCDSHYQQWRSGRDLTPLGVERKPSPCALADCDSRAVCRGWCQKHYNRWRTTGDPNQTPSGRKQRPPGPCAVESCPRPRRKRDWCEMHYNRWRVNGSVDDAAQSWVLSERGPCVVCGRDVPDGIGFRRYCSPGCATAQRPRPAERPCELCDAPIDLLERYPGSGRLKYSSRATCDACRPPAHLTKYVPFLVRRDGLDCSLCDSAVDLSLKYPNPLSRSVDHVIPRSKGGADDPSNYALAHLICNVRKNNRLPGEVMSP